MTAVILITAATCLAEVDKKPFTVPKSPTEYGHGLTKTDALAGWISLFDGATTYGWTSAAVKNGRLAGGVSTTEFGSCEIRADVAVGGRIKLGDQVIAVKPGMLRQRIVTRRRGRVTLDGVVVKSLAIRPLGLASVFDGKSFAGWQVIRHPRLPDERQAKWEVRNRAIHAVGGPGALELQRQFANLVLQISVHTQAQLVNGGVFFRSQPKLFMQGYEAQVFNACYDGDRAKPARYSSGAIDDRQLARRLVSSDKEKYVMTVIAAGPHVATWVNGYQMTDWTDTRMPHDNPRRGRRVKAGTIQLQAHDPETDVEFSNVRILELP